MATQAQGSWQGLSFKLFGIPVLVRPPFLLVGLMFGALGGTLQTGAAWVGVIFVSVLMHEMGHATVMRLYGFSPRIELHALGGVTSWSRERSATAKQRLLVTLAGPGAGLLLGGLVWVVTRTVDSSAVPLLGWALQQALWANIAWSFVNLLPVLPWDGGLVVDAVTELLAGKPRPKVAAGLSMVVGALVVVAAATLFQKSFMLIYLGGIGVWTGWTRWKLPAVDPDAAGTAWVLLRRGEVEAAELLVRQTLVQTGDPQARGPLLEVLAWCRLAAKDVVQAEKVVKAMGDYVPSRLLRARLAVQAGRDSEVLELLTPPVTVPEEVKVRAATLLGLNRVAEVMADGRALLALPPSDELRVSVHLVCAALFYGGEYQDALALCRESFQTYREPTFLFDAACCLMKLGRSDEAMAELTRAVDAGYADTEGLLRDEDLAPLHAQPGWPELLKRLPPTSS